jgi:D-3-phosphoglycerate dehydrogenase
MKAVRTDRELECPIIDAGLRRRGLMLVQLPDGVTEPNLAREAADADILLTCYTPVTARVIEGARRLKGIVKYGVGIDAIDIAAAMRCGIPVVNAPDYAEETVAEGAFALLLALAKRLPSITKALARDGWVWPDRRWLGQDIAGKTLGLVGVGRIGRRMARIAGAGFGARVMGFDPYVDSAAMRTAGIEKVEDLHSMLAACDFVSVHCVLNGQTRNLIGEAEFGCMRPSAVFINVSRGAIVDEAALVRAIVEGRIAGAGLDVYCVEPLEKHGQVISPLFGRDNVVLFPHLTFFTVEAMQRLEEDVLARCDEILGGRPVTVRSRDPRLLAQSAGVRFV